MGCRWIGWPVDPYFGLPIDLWLIDPYFGLSIDLWAVDPYFGLSILILGPSKDPTLIVRYRFPATWRHPVG
jgi:hypothetical protein